MTEGHPLPLPLAIDPADGGAELKVVRPWDRSLLARVRTLDLQEARRALDAARTAQGNPDAALPAETRIAILAEAGRRMAADAESWAAGIAEEGGKPLKDARIEVARAVDGIKGCIEVLRTEGGREIPMNLNAASAGRWAFTRRVPGGVVLAFSAFNHPLNLAVHQVGPAVAAGCAVLLKPAEATPLSALRFIRLLHDCGLPPAWAQALLVSDLDTAGKLAALEGPSIFSFIGSARVGWQLRANLAPGVRCALEHGGNASAIVMPDADLDAAVAALTRGAFYHAGQVCVSVQRVYAPAPFARLLAERLAEAADRLVVGDPRRPETDVGPLIRPAEVERVERWIREAVDAGAGCLTGGGRVGAHALRPAVLWDAPEDSRVMAEEVFGPVVCVNPVANLEEAIGRANRGPHAFQSAIFTADLRAALRAADRLDAAAVLVNDPTTFRVDWMPFGGYRNSGLGVSGIPATFREYTREKLVVMH